MSTREDTRLPLERVESLIFTVRGRRVILDADLARIYGVPTRRLNEQVEAVEKCLLATRTAKILDFYLSRHIMHNIENTYI